MSKQEPIHSGHFMTSNPHTEIQPDDEDEDVDVVDVDDGISSAVPLDKNAAKEKDGEKPVTFYKFGPQKTQSIAIDVSLNKLNKCIRVAYMKMTTPKWKDFKGLKLQWKHRIRLNNVIWRAYYMEFRKPDRKRRAPYCYFSVPDDDTTHTKIEGSVLEGMYWKRRMEAVCAQYKRWRTFNSKKKRCCRKRENSCGCELAPRMQKKGNQSQPNSQQRSLTPENLISLNNDWFLGPMFDFDDDLDNEFTDQLFEQLNAPFLFPNPKEGAVQCANADIMQPGLLSLQPSIEDIMSTGGPFGEDLVDPVEFANSLPMPSVDNQLRHFPPPQSAGKAMPSQQSQQYTNKEFDAANMLLDYSNQTQPFPLTSSVSRRTAPVESTSTSRQNINAPQLPLTAPVLTPNVSNPLYSQAIYEPQRIGGQRAQQEAPALFGSNTPASFESTTAYGARGTPSMSTKIANQVCPQPPPTRSIVPTIQTSLTHQTITSMASTPHSQFLPSAIDYSILVAASSSAAGLSQALASTSTARQLQQPSLAQWQTPTWFSPPQQHTNQHSQQVFLPPQSQTLRKTSSVNTVQPSTAAQKPAQLVPPLVLPANNNSFDTQSLLASSRTPSIPYVSSFTNLVNPHQSQQSVSGGRQQSALSAHLQQKPQQQNPLFQSLASSVPPQTVRQFVMSDLSRYLTQQSPIGVSQGLQSGAAHSFVQNLAVNTLPSNMGGGLSPVGAPHYSPATTPLSAPIIVGFGQQSQTSSQSQRQQPPRQLHSVDSAATFSSPPPLKKASTSVLPSQTEFQQQTLSPPKRGRASFSTAQRPANLGKRQLQQRQMLETQQKQQQFAGQMGGEQQMFPAINRTENAQFVQSPTKTSRRLSNRRQQSQFFDAPAQIASPLTPPSIQQVPAPEVIPHSDEQQHSVRTGVSEQVEQAVESSEDGEGQASAFFSSSTLLHQMAVKEENADEKPALPLSSYKRRHGASSTSGTDASSSHSAPADSTLHPEERKRILHLNAEKNRRSALKEGFESLVDAIPMVEQAGVKCTNAVVLNRAAQHIRSLKSEEEQQQRQIKSFREKITNMNERIALIQSNLPSSSTSGSKAGDSSSPSMRIQVEQFFDRYKRDRSRDDFRFWLMGEVLKPIVHSMAEQVHPDATDRELVMLSARKWLETHWNSAVLRPIASDTLVRLATSGGAFTSEKALNNYVVKQVNQESPGNASHSSQQ